MRKNWKKEEEFLNSKGLPSARQARMLQKLKALLLPDLSIAENSEIKAFKITYEEFKAKNLRSYLPDQLKYQNRSVEDILKTVPESELNRDIDEAEESCRRDYTYIVVKAIQDKSEGVSTQTLLELQFEAKYLKAIKVYCRHYKIQL